MKINQMLLTAGAAAFMGLAMPSPASATWCWFGKCGGSSSGGSSTGGSSGGSGTPTPVPEPEQMALFGMGAAVLVGRVFIARRRKK